MRKTKLIFAAAAAAIASSPAYAAGNTMIINANVASACTFQAADVTVDMTNIRTGVTVTGNYDIWCTNGYAVNVTATSANSFALSNGTDTIAYTLQSGGVDYSAGIPFTGGVSTTPSQLPYTLAFAAQNPGAGTYTDTVTFTVAP